MPNSFAYNDDVKPITQDLLKAKALLKEAGYDEKNDNEKYKWILEEASTRSWREIKDEFEDYE
jgi:ABC-type transport system substrate-binding protein